MKNFWTSIHYLRAIAALMVVAHHVPYALNSWGFKTSLAFDLGAWGVDLFFVISGFVMASTSELTPGRATAKRFLVSRFIRIVPMYWVVILFPVLLGLVFPSIFRSFNFPIEQVLKSMFFVPYLDDRGLMRPVVSQGWTLNFEMYFYATIALALLFFSRWRLLAIFALSITVFFAIRMDVFSFPSVMQVYAAPIVFEFLLGLLLPSFVVRMNWQASYKLPFGIFCIAFAVVILINAPAELHQEYNSIDRFAYWGSAAFATALGFCLLEPVFGKAKIAMLLGDASYAIYLVHGLVFGLLLKLIPKSTPLLLVGTLAFFAAILVGQFFHLLLEKPITKILRDYLVPAKNREA